MSSLCVRPTLRPSIFCTVLLHALTIKLSGNLKFDFGFFNAFLLVKYKNSILKCSWRAYYAPFAVLWYILFSQQYTSFIHSYFKRHSLFNGAEFSKSDNSANQQIKSIRKITHNRQLRQQIENLRKFTHIRQLRNSLADVIQVIRNSPLFCLTLIA